MIATPDNATLIAQGLDHPECLCFGPDGTLYAGGEAGQLYRISPEGEATQIATTSGFLLGIAADGNSAIHVCDTEHRAVFRIDPDGTVTVRSKGTAAQPFTLPNFPVFDAGGNLYVSESGEYWHDEGTGQIFVIRPDDTTEIFHHGPFRFANGLAIDPTQTWLYVTQSTAGNVVRVPLGKPDGPVEVLVEDLTAELLCRPANVALHDGKLFIANLGGWHLTTLPTDLRPTTIHRPVLRSPRPLR